MDDTALSDLFEKYEAEGLADGEACGREEGREGDDLRDFARGFSQGYARARIIQDIAERLLAQGLAAGHVGEVTGLPPERVEGIAELMRLTGADGIPA